MRQRVISSVGIVLVGLIPAIIGDWVFAAVFTGIALQAYTELARMLELDSIATAGGAALVVLFGAIALLSPDGDLFPLVIALTALLPAVVALVLAWQGGQQEVNWIGIAASAVYIGLPAYAAIALRAVDEPVSAAWFTDFVDTVALDTAAAGLAWLLLAILVTWISDSAAYLVGKNIGRTRLSPHISPSKTVEGVLGGLVGGALTAQLAATAFGLELHPLASLSLGALVALLGMIGDLAESMMKRRAGVKDSGTLIPGHGGVFDRIDALLFAIVTVWLVAPLFK